MPNYETQVSKFLISASRMFGSKKNCNFKHDHGTTKRERREREKAIGRCNRREARNVSNQFKIREEI